MWPFHRHLWKLVGIFNDPAERFIGTEWRIVSYWIYECSRCHRHKQKRFFGHFQMPGASSTDKEVQELRKMAGLPDESS
jgi:hypothetical protein